MKTDYDKMEDRSLNLGGAIPLKQEDIIAAYRSQDRDARLLGEYWALNLRIRGLEHILKLKKKQKEGKTYSPEPLMIMQIKAMKKYANALAIRLDYEQSGRANPEVIARIKAMSPKGEPAIVLTPEAEEYLDKALEEESPIKAMHGEVDATIGNADVAEPIASGTELVELEDMIAHALPGGCVPTGDGAKEEE